MPALSQWASTLRFRRPIRPLGVFTLVPLGNLAQSYDRPRASLPMEFSTGMYLLMKPPPRSGAAARRPRAGLAGFLMVLAFVLLGAVSARADPDSAGLLEALARYRIMAQEGGWPLVPGKDEVLIDGDDVRLPILLRRLEMTGDLPLGAIDSAAVHAAVRGFQRRHGLEVDGRIGAKTLQALNVPVQRRIEQIEVNLERWRLTAYDPSGVHMVVNVADATLDLFDGGVRVMRSRVIVGDAKHPTPVFTSAGIAVTFNPAWNVPSSIARLEILPRLKRDRAYLAANDMVLRDRDTGDIVGGDIDWPAMAVDRFPYRLQQRPGPKNALGLFKLEMPNIYDVYLHDTPARQLFNRPARFFSHGCIRVEAIDQIVRYLLRDPVRWSAERMADITQTGLTTRVSLPAPVRIYIEYWTAFIGPDGTLNFRNDVYGRDQPYLAALAAQAIAVPADAPPVSLGP